MSDNHYSAPRPHWVDRTTLAIWGEINSVEWCEQVLASSPTPAARMVAEALMASGHYEVEAPDAVEWLRLDSQHFADVALVIAPRDGRSPAVALLDALDDCALHTAPYTEESLTCAKRDIDRILAALGQPAEEWADVPV